MMFIGFNSYSSIADSCPLLRIPVLQLLFWLTHLLAVYMTASALIAKLGGRLISFIRLKALRFHDVIVLRGNSPEVLQLAENTMQRNRKARLLFLSDSADEKAARTAVKNGGLWMNEADVLTDDEGRWIRNFGAAGRSPHRLEIWSLTEDDDSTKEFLLRLLPQLQKNHIPASRVHFSVGVFSDYDFEFLRKAGDAEHSLYSVDIFTAYGMAASNLVHRAPPYLLQTFDADGRAKAGLSILVVGTGKMGQAVIRTLAMNSQFCGGESDVLAVDKDSSVKTGAFREIYSFLLDLAHVSLISEDVLSNRFLSNMHESGFRPDYAVVCTGTAESNREIAEEITAMRLSHPEYFGSRFILAACDKASVTLYDCTVGGKTKEPLLIYSEPERNDAEIRNLVFSNYEADMMSAGSRDRLAFSVNAVYARALGDDPVLSWKTLNYFSRASSRASAEFIPAVLASAHLSADSLTGDLFRKRLSENPVLLTNLSITEHLRWCAFQAAYGIAPMSRAEMKERSLRGEHSIQKVIPPRGIGGRHVCLVPWEELDSLSEEYNALTGSRTDFKQMDTNNVLAIPEVLRGNFPQPGDTSFPPFAV
jgi:hypothetical protein